MQSSVFLARIDDAIDVSSKSQKPKFIGFLSKEEKILAEKYLDNRNVKYTFFGGYNDAERQFLCCQPECVDNITFPIDALTFIYRTNDTLKHRDFLGSLMALGIKRESIGDILVEVGRAVVFLNTDISEYVFQNISKIGRVGVKILKDFSLPLPLQDTMKEFSLTIASLRLDCVVSACAGVARNKAVELIENGLVSVNSIICQKVTKTIDNGDVLAVRTKGKFQICSCNNLSKKQRIILIYKTY